MQQKGEYAWWLTEDWNEGNRNLIQDNENVTETLVNPVEIQGQYLQITS
jgi:hypothetical protein